MLENMVEDGDGCLWYLVNLTVDTTLGVLFCFIFHSIIEAFALRNGIDVLRSGEYWPKGHEAKSENVDFRIWFA